VVSNKAFDLRNHVASVGALEACHAGFRCCCCSHYFDALTLYHFDGLVLHLGRHNFRGEPRIELLEFQRPL
jgi:hypothetical protein